MLKTIVNELETRVRYYQRLENQIKEKEKKNFEEDDAFFRMKTAFELASEERDLLRTELDGWLDQRKADLDAQMVREDHFLNQINGLNNKLATAVWFIH